MFGLKAGILAVASPRGRRCYPEPVFDADRVLARVAAEGITVLPGAPTIYQSILDHPDRDAHDLSTLRVAVTGAADIPVELIERIRDELPFSRRRHRLRADRGRHRVAPPRPTTTPRPSPPPSAGPGPASRSASSTATRDVAAGEPGEVVLRGPVGDGRLPRRPRGHRRRALRRRLAAHRRPRRARRARQPAHRRADQGHVHRRRLQRLPGRDRERPAPPPRRAAGGGDRHPRRAPRRGRAWPSSSPRPATPTSAPAILAWCQGRRWPTTRCPARIELVDELPSTPPARS